MANNFLRLCSVGKSKIKAEFIYQSSIEAQLLSFALQPAWRKICVTGIYSVRLGITIASMILS